MFVLGVDPGLSRCGYCVLSVGPAAAPGRWRSVCSRPPSTRSPKRLADLQPELRELLDDYPPSAVAIERVLFQVNVRTAMSVGQASGIAMAEAAGRGCDVIEYSPNQVKEAVAGYGAADKEQMQEMVQPLLGHSAVLRPADAADAAAVALCHVAYAPSMVTAR
ncbi:MAG: crossover junction endodeoxyribonuclease RuvC [Microthrixaceae bacterium]